MTGGPASGGPRLTAPELRVLAEVAAGRTGAAIAARLFLSTTTVERHVASAVRRLGARNRAHAVALAMAAGELPGCPVDDAELDAVTGTMRQACLGLDRDGRVARVNPAAERLLGWSEAELAGQHVHDVVRAPRPVAARRGDPVEDPTAPLSGDRFVVRGGAEVPVVPVVTRFERRDGTEGWVVLLDPGASGAPASGGDRAPDASMLRALRRTLRQDGFVLYAQPIVDLADERPCAQEVLLRMIGPDGALVGPERVLPVAARHGLLVAVDERVCRQAVRSASPDAPVHVNVSARSLADDRLVAVLDGAFAAADVDPSLVIFELPGAPLADGDAPGVAVARGIGQLGCGVALDDFVARPAALSSLRRLLPALRALKLDTRPLPDLRADAGARATVRAVVELAGGHGATTIAQGVEGRATADVLRELGVEQAQGHLFGAARPPADADPR